MTGVQIDIPVSSPLPHAEVAGSVEPETRNLQAGRTYRRRHPVTAACAAEVEVWRDAMRALRGMSRQSAVASVTSGLICGLVMFVFCVVFSEMIFGQHELLMRAVPLGVGTQTSNWPPLELGTHTFCRSADPVFASCSVSDYDDRSARLRTLLGLPGHYRGARHQPHGLPRRSRQDDHDGPLP